MLRLRTVLALAIALALAITGPAALGAPDNVAGPPAPPPPPRAHYNVADFGAVEGKPCDAAVSAALAQIATDRAGKTWTGATLYFPPGKFTVAEPVAINLEFLEVAGEARHVSTVTKVGCLGSTFAFGLADTPGGKALSPDHWGPTGLVGMPRAWRAFHAKGADGYAELGFWASPFSMPPGYWTQTPVFTFDLAWEAVDPAAPAGPIVGIGDYRGARPFWTGRNGPVFYWNFATSDGVQRQLAIPDPNPHAGIRRLVVQLDMDAAKALAWVDDLQVVPLPRIAATPDVWKPGMRLLRNETNAFQVGNLNWALGSAGGKAQADTIYHGLAVVAKARYADGGPGSPIARLDGRPIADATRYTALADPADTLGSLAFDLADVGRHVHSRGSAGLAHGHIFTIGAQGNGWNQVGHLGIRDLTLASSTYGQPVAIGNVLDFSAERLEIIGGWNAIGRAPVGGAWPVRIRDIESIWAKDAALDLPDVIGSVRDITSKYPGECTLRLQGGQLSATDVFCTAPGGGDYIVRSLGWEEGSTFHLSDWSIDTEGAVKFPAKGGFYAETGGRRPSTLTLERINFGTLPAGGALVDLHTGGAAPGYFSIRDSVVFPSPFAAAIRADGPGWSGAIERLSTPQSAARVLSPAAAPSPGAILDRD